MAHYLVSAIWTEISCFRVFFRDFLEYHFLRVCWPDLFWIRMQRRRSICLPTSLLQARWTAARQNFSVCEWFSIQWHQGKEILAMPSMSQKHLFWKNDMLFFRFLDAIEQYLHYPFFIFSWEGGIPGTFNPHMLHVFLLPKRHLDCLSVELRPTLRRFSVTDFVVVMLRAISRQFMYIYGHLFSSWRRLLVICKYGSTAANRAEE